LTDGCIALSDRDIDELYQVIPVGTTVEIRE
jgi:lipoprotein-anchoring transpeptidase ErfK/SrfK